MVELTVTLSDAEYKALQVIAYDPVYWIENFTKNRCAVAIDEIYRAEVDRKLNLGESVSGTKEEIVVASPVQTAKQIQDAYQSGNRG